MFADSSFASLPLAGLYKADVYVRGGIIDFSYKVYNKKEKSVAYKIYNQSLIDLSWLLKGGDTKDLSYKIFCRTINKSSWKIYVIDQTDISSKIFNGATLSSSAMIFNLNLHSMAWPIGVTNYIEKTVLFNEIFNNIEFVSDDLNVVFDPEYKTITFI